ncbi:MAG: hypothetical protein ABSG84_02090 [Acidobacteriaceae bacterium]|jgi:hypothetical protein
MAYGDGNEQIRKRAWEKYIAPQIQKGASAIVLPIRPLMKEMEAEGFKTNRPRQFCTALQKREFLREKNLVLDRVDGPPSGTSTTVVLHFRYAGGSATSGVAGESPAQRASRLTEKLRGLMKDEIAAHGGAEGFIRWVRSDEDEDVA